MHVIAHGVFLFFLSQCKPPFQAIKHLNNFLLQVSGPQIFKKSKFFLFCFFPLKRGFTPKFAHCVWSYYHYQTSVFYFLYFYITFYVFE